MNINATLIAQMLVFAGLIWITMKYIWPVLLLAMEQREKTIADGLAAAEEGKKSLELARQEADKLLAETRGKTEELIAKAQKRADDMVNQAKQEARTEAERITSEGREQLKRDYARAKDELRGEMSGLIIAGIEKVLETEISKEEHERLVKSAMESIH